jgi:hypothetical protein
MVASAVSTPFFSNTVESVFQFAVVFWMSVGCTVSVTPSWSRFSLCRVAVNASKTLAGCAAFGFALGGAIVLPGYALLDDGPIRNCLIGFGLPPIVGALLVLLVAGREALATALRNFGR